MSLSSSTHQEPIDLESIKARFNNHGNEWPEDYASQAVSDIPLLIAEVERLRTRLAYDHLKARYDRSRRAYL